MLLSLRVHQRVERKRLDDIRQWNGLLAVKEFLQVGLGLIQGYFRGLFDSAGNSRSCSNDRRRVSKLMSCCDHRKIHAC